MNKCKKKIRQGKEFPNITLFSYFCHHKPLATNVETFTVHFNILNKNSKSPKQFSWCALRVIKVNVFSNLCKSVILD